MSAVYVSVLRYNFDQPQLEAECLENWEFTADTWMEALDKAYDWLKTNRREELAYHVWC